MVVYTVCTLTRRAPGLSSLTIVNLAYPFLGMSFSKAGEIENLQAHDVSHCMHESSKGGVGENIGS